MNPYQIVKDFENAVAEYTGAPFVVAVNSCTMALWLALKWQKVKDPTILEGKGNNWVVIPKYTYVSVAQSIILTGFTVEFEDRKWLGQYQLKPYPIWDSARLFTSDMFRIFTASEIVLREHGIYDKFQCVSFHSSKTLADTQGGAILHDSEEADEWFRRARFDGRREGVVPKDDNFILGYHCSMSPDIAARLLVKLSVLPEYNDPLPNDEYPDLSKQSIFQ